MTKQHYAEFAARLSNLMVLAKLSDSPTKLTRAFNAVSGQKPVTTHAARKWIMGQSIPTQERLVVLSKLLGSTPQYLRYGVATEFTAPPPLTGDQQVLLAYFDKASPTGRKAMLLMGAALSEVA